METPITQTTILIIDDDISLGQLLQEYAQNQLLRIKLSPTGEEGLELIAKELVALVVLDVMLPGLDGFEVLERIRTKSSVPVLMLTTRGATSDRIRGLRSGADDYLPKPFEPAELFERIRSILRRVEPRNQGMSFIKSDDLELDSRSRVVRRGGELIDLTGAEFSLLRLLLSNPGKVMSREELVRGVLERESTLSDRAIDNLVSNIRKKLGLSIEGKDRIRSVRGIGYVYTQLALAAAQ